MSRKLLRRLIGPALLAVMLPMPAAGFLAQNGMRVAQLTPTEIAVIPRARRDNTDYWCAAGDFAQRALGLPGQTRLWRATPKPAPAGQPVIFTLDAANGAEGAGLSHFGAGPRDGSLSLSMAVRNFCRSRFPWDDQAGR